MARAAFADDLFSLSGTHEGFQRDADVVSAFALFATMDISPGKLRATWVRNSSSEVPGRPEFLLHGRGWTPLPVAFCDRPFKHLGVLQSGKRGGDDTFGQVHRDLQLVCLRLGNLGLSPEATWDCLYKAIYPKILYVIRFMAWPLSRYGKLDKPINKLLRRVTLNGRSYPSVLLYLPQSEGGLGFCSLSAMAQERKLKLLSKLEWGDARHRHTASSLLGRALRGVGVLSSQGRCCPLRSDHRPDLGSEVWWISSLLEWLQVAGLTLTINGPEWQEGRRPLFLSQRSSESVPLLEMYRALLEAGVTTAAEWQSLSGQGCPAFPRELSSMVQAGGEIDARPGQFWIARGDRGEAMDGAVVELLSFRSTMGVEEVSVLFWRPRQRARLRCPAEAAVGDKLEQGGADTSSSHRGRRHRSGSLSRIFLGQKAPHWSIPHGREARLEAPPCCG